MIIFTVSRRLCEKVPSILYTLPATITESAADGCLKIEWMYKQWSFRSLLLPIKVRLSCFTAKKSMWLIKRDTTVIWCGPTGTLTMWFGMLTINLFLKPWRPSGLVSSIWILMRSDLVSTVWRRRRVLRRAKTYAIWSVELMPAAITKSSWHEIAVHIYFPTSSRFIYLSLVISSSSRPNLHPSLSIMI